MKSVLAASVILVSVLVFVLAGSTARQRSDVGISRQKHLTVAGNVKSIQTQTGHGKTRQPTMRKVMTFTPMENQTEHSITFQDDGKATWGDANPLEQELAAIDDSIREIQFDATVMNFATPNDYAQLLDLEKARWASIKRHLGRELFLTYFYLESNAGRRLAEMAAPLHIPEEEQVNILAKMTNDGEDDEFDADAAAGELVSYSSLQTQTRGWN